MFMIKPSNIFRKAISEKLINCIFKEKKKKTCATCLAKMWQPIRTSAYQNNFHDKLFIINGQFSFSVHKYK